MGMVWQSYPEEEPLQGKLCDRQHTPVTTLWHRKQRIFLTLNSNFALGEMLIHAIVEWTTGELSNPYDFSLTGIPMRLN